ncbi:curli-like amyloid fiber formation chaperone CsgH [Aeromonas bivalvium]|uniref:curli-like amyloid fiber formation chaperone CsgH n=1 Tax=Aeromonas bivalvium TaxID=440079 RepID=UPI0038D10B9A
MRLMFGGLRAPFSFSRRRGGNLWWCLLPLPWLMTLAALAEENEMTPVPSVQFNAISTPTGLSLAPTLHSGQPVTLGFTLDLWSEGAAGQSHQRQGGQVRLLADRPHGLGRLSLGLSCPYQVRVRVQLWQGEALLSEQEQHFSCPSPP